MRTRFSWVHFLIAIVLLSWSFSLEAGSFTQVPGFKKFFRIYPPKNSVPTEDEKKLLFRFRPRFYLKESQTSFIDFYKDYIAHGVLKDAQGRNISIQVNQIVLNQFKEDPTVVFSHRETDLQGRSVVYGRVDYDSISYDGQQISLIFLTYQLVFRYSGLPEGIKSWKKWILRLISSPEDWHQLDHYVAATIVLDFKKNPLAVTLQQHNYQTTYIFNKSVKLPSDQRIELDIAIGSNELYPHYKGKKPRK